MPSDFLHIDEFLKRKEQEATIKSAAETHWREMQNLLVKPSPKTKFYKTKVFLKYAAGVLFIITITVAVIVTKNKSSIAINHSTTKSTETAGKTPIHTPVNNSIAGELNKKEKQNPNNRSLKSTEIKNNVVVHTKSKVPTIKNNETTSELFVASNTTGAILKEPASQLTIESFYQQLKKQAQVFEINTYHDTVITCKEGTKVFIPAASFQTATGLAVTGFITLHIQEFYDLSDIIANKLNTTSNGQILASGGMLNIKAMSNSQALTLKPEKKLELQMPTRKFDPLMQLFTAKDSILNNQADVSKNIDLFATNEFNWLEAGQKQIFLRNRLKYIDIPNFMDNPVYTYTKPNDKIVGKFILPYNSNLSTDEVKQELERKYSKYYDIIKVKKQWKPLFRRKKFDYDKENSKFYEWPENWYETPYVGNTISIPLAIACRLKLITGTDSLNYENKFKEQIQKMIDTNGAYKDYVQMLDKYSFSISALGWINCDRFFKYPGAKTDLVVKTGEFSDRFVQAMLIFPKINSVLQGAWYKGMVGFQNLPMNQKASLVCLCVKDGKAYVAIRDLVTSNEGISDLQFEEISAQKFTEKLKRFGNVKFN